MLSLTSAARAAWAVAAVLGVVGPVGVTAQSGGTPLNPAALAKWAQPLPKPRTAQTTAANTYHLTFAPTTHTFHPSLTPTTVYGICDAPGACSYPGPTVEAVQGTPTHVTWTNELPLIPDDANGNRMHLLGPISPVPLQDVTPANPPGVRTVPHLHGGHSDMASDGFPDAWWTSDGQSGPVFHGTGNSRLYTYRNDQTPAPLWYHDHAIGITRLNVYAGIAGFYMLRPATGDPSLTLSIPGGPSDPRDIPIAIQDRSFYTSGNLYYPSNSVPYAPEFFGDVAVVNGKVWPVLNVDRSIYRLRLLNGCNARVLRMWISDEQGKANSFIPMVQIGSDGGLLRTPVTFTGAPGSRLTLAPGERAEVLLDFTNVPVKAGQRYIVRNDAPGPFQDPTAPPPGASAPLLPELFAISISGGPKNNQYRVPTSLPGPAPGGKCTATTTDRTAVTATTCFLRTWTMREMPADASGNVKLLLNDLPWDAAVTDIVPLGSTEVWEFDNLTPDTHPMHVHLVQFKVVGRTGVFNSVEPNELGWKDTVKVYPAGKTRVEATFDIAGTYPVHCHILEHEDYDMMRPFTVAGSSRLRA